MIITAIKGTQVKTRDELIDVLKNTKPKDTVAVMVKSDNKEKTLKVVLAEAPKTETQMIKIKVKGDDIEDEEMKMLMTPEMECPKCGHKMEIKMGKTKMKMMGKHMECDMGNMEMGPMKGKCPMMMEKGMPMEKGMMIPPKETRGFIGIVTEEDDGQLVIQSIVPQSPAEKAGLLKGDIISEINGIAVTTPQELIEVLKTTKPDNVAHLNIVSAGVPKMVNVVLAPPPQAPQPNKMKMKFKVGRKHAKHGRGAGYFGPGFTMFKYGGLNTLFSKHGLDTIKSRQFIFGGGGWGQAGRVRIGGYGVGGGQTLVNDSVSVDVGYGVGFFEVGYSLINTKHFMLTPLLGIGGGGLGMKITTRHEPSSLDSLLYYPGGKSQVSKGGLAMYPGLAIDIPISFVGLSLKGGYIWTPMTSGWIHEGFGTITGPDINLNGPFASLNVMFGGGK